MGDETLATPKAQCQLLKRQSITDDGLVSLKRRPEDSYQLPDNEIYKQDGDEYIVLEQRNIFVHVTSFKKGVYICVRQFFFNPMSLKWVPHKTGLNLSISEWRTLTNSHMQGLIRDAINQLEEGIPPTVKENLEHEMMHPTSWPIEITSEVMQHRYKLSPNKCAVIDRCYSPVNRVQVSLLQFDSDPEADPMVPTKGIHLSVDAWDKLSR